MRESSLSTASAIDFRRPIVVPTSVYRSLAGSAIAAVVLWVTVFATGTSAGPAIREPGEFVVTVLNGLTFAGLLFVVASGLTPIFGLMRTVNTAHGSLFLLSAYVAIEVQRQLVGKERNIDSADVSLVSWLCRYS